jgi:hypothetical protein
MIIRIFQYPADLVCCLIPAMPGLELGKVCNGFLLFVYAESRYSDQSGQLDKLAIIMPLVDPAGISRTGRKYGMTMRRGTSIPACRNRFLSMLCFHSG